MHKKIIAICLPVLGGAIIVGAGFSAWVWNETTTTDSMSGTISITSDVHGLTPNIYKPTTVVGEEDTFANAALWDFTSDVISLTLDQAGAEDPTEVGVSSSTVTTGITSDPDHYYLELGFEDVEGLIDALKEYDLKLSYSVTITPSDETSWNTYITTLESEPLVLEGSKTFEYVDEETNPVHVFDIPLLWQYVFKPGNGTDYHTMLEALEGDTFKVAITATCEWVDPSNEVISYTENDDGTIVIASLNIADDEEEIVIPSTVDGKTVVGIANRAFRGKTNFTRVVFPSTLTSIGRQAFNSCSTITNLDFSAISGDLTIDYNAFYGCSSLTSVDFPDTIGTLTFGDGVFGNCTNLTSFDAKADTVVFGDDLFSYSLALTSIALPANLEFPETEVATNGLGNAFSYCNNVTEITVHGEGEYFTTSDNKCLLTDNGATLVFCCEDEENPYPSNIPETVTKIGAFCFEGWTSISGELEIPSNITTIGKGAFENCDGITSVVIPETVYVIEYGAFIGCESLTTAVIPNTVSSIGIALFTSCTNLKSVTLPDNITEIPASMFTSCTSLTSIAIPEGVEVIGEDAFKSTGLTSITLPESCTTICDSAFWGPKFTELTIPANVTYIGKRVIYWGRVKNVYFKVAENWKAGETDLSSTDLANSETACTYLMSTYCNVVWTRS